MIKSGEYLARATVRAGKLLGISDAAIARVIGVSDAEFSRIVRGACGLPPAEKSGELGQMLVTVSRSLDRLVGRNREMRHAWMRQYNDALGGAPAEVIERVDGLVATRHYLDGVQAGHFLLRVSPPHTPQTSRLKSTPDTTPHPAAGSARK